MEQVFKLAENYVMQRVMSNHSPLTHANKALMALFAFGGLLLLIAIGFILSGFYQWFIQIMPLHEANMVFGVLLLAFSLSMFCIITYGLRRKKEKTEALKNHMRDEVLLNLKLAQAELKDMHILENHPKTCVALASLAGFILSEKAL